MLSVRRVVVVVVGVWRSELLRAASVCVVAALEIRTRLIIRAILLSARMGPRPDNCLVRLQRLGHPCFGCK